MTASVLVSGKLHRDPERKMSRALKPFVSAVIRDSDGENCIWWQVLCFSDSGSEELMGLQAGDGVAVSGSFKAEAYTAKDGVQKVGFTVFADGVLSAKRRKRDKDRERRAETKTAEPAAAADPFDDAVPF